MLVKKNPPTFLPSFGPGHMAYLADRGKGNPGEANNNTSAPCVRRYMVLSFSRGTPKHLNRVVVLSFPFKI